MQGQRLDGFTLRKGFQIEWDNPNVDADVRREAKNLRQAGELSMKDGKLIRHDQLISQTLVFPGDKLFSTVERVFNQVLGQVQAISPLCFFQQFIGVGATNQPVPFLLCGVALEMGKNRYVKLQGSGDNAPSYGTLRQQVDTYCRDNGDVQLAREVRNALRWAGVPAPANTVCSDLAGLLAGILGVAEPSRKPTALPMLLMFLDLIEAGRISWARGLGPQATDRSSLSAQERATYFGKGRAEIDNDVKQIDNATAGVKVTDKPEEQWLKKFVALHDLQGEVKRMVLSEGNVKSISGLGGALPMVGAQTAASGDMSKDSPAIALVDKKEVTVVVEWFSWKLGQIQTQMEQGSQNSRKVWIALGGPKQQQIIEWLLRLQLLGQLDQTVLTQAQQDAQQLL